MGQPGTTPRSQGGPVFFKSPERLLVHFRVHTYIHLRLETNDFSTVPKLLLRLPPTIMAYPPGGTFFDTGKRSFKDVAIDESKDNAISTSEFLEASESLTALFDVLGSAAFKPVKNDMTGNINVRTTRPTTKVDRDTLTEDYRKSGLGNWRAHSTPKPSNQWCKTSSKRKSTPPPKGCSG